MVIKSRLAVTLAAVLVSAGMAQPSFAAETLVVQESRFSVAETLDRLAKTLGERGVKVVARIDHAAGAKAAGMTMPPTELLIFGNPKLGTPLMQANPMIAADLPMKVLAWQGADGKVLIGYTPPSALAARYAITDKGEVVDAMTKALAGMTKAAAGN